MARNRRPIKRPARDTQPVTAFINASPKAHRSIIAELFKPLAGIEIAKKIIEGTDIPCWELPVLECKRCRWRWNPITNNRPKRCPKCARLGWEYPESIWSRVMEARENPRKPNKTAGGAYRRILRGERVPKPRIEKLVVKPPSERFADRLEE